MLRPDRLVALAAAVCIETSSSCSPPISTGPNIFPPILRP